MFGMISLGTAYTMISFTEPKHGWLGLILKSGNVHLHYEISDVGPDSLSQFRQLVDELHHQSRLTATIECFLEPTILTLICEADQDVIILHVLWDGRQIHTLKAPRASFTAQLRSELERITPLCIDPHWTH